jgi:hypothetical protein
MIATTVLQAISEFIENPGSILRILGDAFPKVCLSLIQVCH